MSAFPLTTSNIARLDGDKAYASTSRDATTRKYVVELECILPILPPPVFVDPFELESLPIIPTVEEGDQLLQILYDSHLNMDASITALDGPHDTETIMDYAVEFAGQMICGHNLLSNSSWPSSPLSSAQDLVTTPESDLNNLPFTSALPPPPMRGYTQRSHPMPAAMTSRSHTRSLRPQHSVSVTVRTPTRNREASMRLGSGIHASIGNTLVYLHQPAQVLPASPAGGISPYASSTEAASQSQRMKTISHLDTVATAESLSRTGTEQPTLDDDTEVSGSPESQTVPLPLESLTIDEIMAMMIPVSDALEETWWRCPFKIPSKFGNEKVPCTQTCKRLGDMRRHLETKWHKCIKHECLRCRKTFAREDSLKRHQERGSCKESKATEKQDGDRSGRRNTRNARKGSPY